MILRLALALLFCINLTSCASKIGSVGTSSDHHVKYSYMYFNDIVVRYISAQAENTIIINYASKVLQGNLILKVLNPDNSIIAELETNTQSVAEIKAVHAGVYQLVIEGIKTKGSYDVSWEIKS